MGIFTRRAAKPTPEPTPARKSADIPWEFVGNGYLTSGMTTEKAVGLPALLGVLRLISGAAMMMPLIVYRGDPPNRTRARDTEQWQLLHRRPYRGVANGASAFRADAFLSLAASGKLLIRKLKVSKKVAELVVLDPQAVEIKREKGKIVFVDSTGDTPIERDERDIIYIRTAAHAGALEGISPITTARIAFQTGLSRQAFERNYYKNDARPGIYFQADENVDKPVAREWLEEWNADHQGVEQAWQPSVLGGGITLKTVPVSLEDAQFVESTRMTLQQIAWIYNIPLVFADATKQPSETDRQLLVTFGLGPYMRALDEGLSFDADIFPPSNETLMVEMLDAALLRPDYVSRIRAYKDAIQGGHMTPNETREPENLPPVEGGDKLQFPVVGGGPVDSGNAADGE